MTSITDLGPSIILDYPLHWFPLLVGIIESQLQFYHNNLEPGFNSSLCGAEEMCYSIWQEERKDCKTHLITFSLWLVWYQWMIAENYSVTKISWLTPEACCWSEIKSHSVILMPAPFPVVCCTIENNWNTY